MSMGDGREIVAGCKDARNQALWMALAAEGMRVIHAHGSHAHHPAAAFAVVHGPRHFAAAGLQSGEAGGSGRAPAEKFFLLEQPARFGVSRGQQPGILLSHQPARVRTGGSTKKVRLLALQNPRDMRGEQGLGGEKRHLSVIGDGAQFSVRGGVVADSSFAVGADNFVQIQEFNGSAQGVADGAAEKASAEAAAQVQIGWNPGKGHFSLEPWERLSLAEQDTANSANSASPLKNFRHAMAG